MTPIPAQVFFHFRCIALNSTINRSVNDINAAFSQHFLEFARTDAIFAVPANSQKDNIGHGKGSCAAPSAKKRAQFINI